MILVCEDCGYEASFDDDDYDSAKDNGWWEDDNGNWYCDNCHGYCRICENEYPNSELVWSNYYDGDICEHCREQYAEMCDNCEEYVDQDQVQEVHFDGNDEHQLWCPNCISRARNEGRAILDNGFWRISENRVDGHIFQQHLHPEIWKEIRECKDCREYDGQRCPKCLRKIAKETEEEETNLWVYDTRAMSYHNSDHVKFKNTKLREKHEHPFLYYGVELEWIFDDRTDISEITKEYIKATKGLFVAEFDRSVTERGNGIEFISRPLSYKKWMSEEVYQLLEAGNEVLKKYHVQNPQQETCGLHVHMSLKFFEENTKKTVKSIKSDLDWMFQVFQPEIEKISRRKYTKFCASKAFRLKEVMRNLRGGYGFNIDSTVNINKGDITVSMGAGDTHHDAVVQTGKTIEVRTFRSTTDTKEILSAIEFCRATAHSARNKKLNSKNTLGDILYSKDSKYLPEYIRKQKVNTDAKFANKLEVKIDGEF